MDEFEYAKSIDGNSQCGRYSDIDRAPAVGRCPERRRYLLRQHRRSRELRADYVSYGGQELIGPHLRDLGHLGRHYDRLRL